MSTFLYYGEFQHYSYCENWIASALDRNGHHCVRLQRTTWFDETRLIAVARQVRADVILFSKTPEIVPAQLQAIKKEGFQIAFWTFDWMRHPTNWEWYAPLAREADICFQTDGYLTDGVYPKAGIRRVELHQGCVPVLHDLPQFDGERPVRYQAEAHDLVFIGSTYTDRRRQLLSEMTGYDFRKWGEPEPQLWGTMFAKTCYLSKIVIGDNFVNDVPGYWSDRVYLTLACGGFFLTAYVEGLEAEFKNHTHLVWWRSFDELHDMIKYYLPREAERRAIALEGYRLVQREHTYDKRIQRMTEHLVTL